MIDVPWVEPDMDVPLSHVYPADGGYDLLVEVVESDGAHGMAMARVCIPEPSSKLLGLASLLALLAIPRRSRARQ